MVALQPAPVVYEAYPGAASRPRVGYARRTPESTPLYQIVRNHLPAMLVEARAHTAHGFGLPRFIEREFERYLGCGILGRGFARVRCDECATESLVAFSCKGRGVCPSCTARRMADAAAHLVDHVLPVARYRQWVWTMPRAVRYWLAKDGARITRVHALFLRAVFAWQRRLARDRGIAGGGQPGAVTFVQRFGGQLNLNVHFHAVVPDGVFTQNAAGDAVFHPLPGPRDTDVLEIASKVARKVLELVADDTEAAQTGGDAVPDDESAALAAAQAAAIDTRTLLPAVPSRRPPLLMHRRSVAFDGFSLHAAVEIGQHDRAGLERLCRYGARPAFAGERITLTDAGQVSYRLKRPWPDGRTHLFMSPTAFLRRLAGILPPPRLHLVRYAGVFAPRATLRAAVVARAPANAAAITAASLVAQDGAALPDAPSSTGKRRRHSRLPWADLLRRVFAEDVLACPCGRRRRVIAFITDPDVVHAILAALGVPANVPNFVPARAPPQPSFDDWLDTDQAATHIDGQLANDIDGQLANDIDDGQLADDFAGHPPDHFADPPAWDDSDAP